MPHLHLPHLPPPSAQHTHTHHTQNDIQDGCGYWNTTSPIDYCNLRCWSRFINILLFKNNIKRQTIKVFLQGAGSTDLCLKFTYNCTCHLHCSSFSRGHFVSMRFTRLWYRMMSQINTVIIESKEISFSVERLIWQLTVTNCHCLKKTVGCIR